MKFFKERTELTEQERIEQLNEQDFQVLLKEKDGKFYLIAPDLSLVATGEDLSEVYDDFKRQKSEYIRNIVESGAEDAVALKTRKSRLSEYVQDQFLAFVLKLVTICVIGGLALTVSMAMASNKLATFSGVTMGKAIVKTSIETMAKPFQFNSPEDKERKMKQWREFLLTLTPYLEEANTILSAEGKAGAATLEKDQ